MRYLLFLSLLVTLLSSCINSVPSSRIDGDGGEQIDKTKFELVSTVPENGELSVDKTLSTIVLTFNQAIRDDIIFPVKLKTIDVDDSNWYVGVYDYTAQIYLPIEALGESGSFFRDNKKELHLVLNGSLAANHNYTVILKKDLMAQNGVALDNATLISFSTKVEPLKYSAFVMSSDPSTEVKVIFNKAIDIATVLTNSDENCSVGENKRGVHLKCNDKCVPMDHPFPGASDTTFTFKPKSDLPFNTTCSLLIYKELIRDTDGQELPDDLTIPVTPIAGFTASGKLTFERIPIEDSHLNTSQGSPRPMPPVKLELLKDGVGSKTTTCKYIGTSHCYYEFTNLQKGAYKLKIKLTAQTETGGTVNVRDNLSMADNFYKTYSFVQDLSTEPIEENLPKDLYFKDSTEIGRASALLDTVWRLHRGVEGSSQFITNIYWNSTNVAVSKEQVDLQKGYLPSTFGEWTFEAPQQIANLYVLGDRRIDSDEQDQQVLAREWAKLLFDKVIGNYEKGRRGSYGKVALNPRAAFYEGLLNGYGLMALRGESSVYSDTSGFSVSDGGSGWSIDYTASELNTKINLWANAEEIGRFFYVAAGIFPATMISDTVKTLSSYPGFTDYFTFLKGFQKLISAGEISEISSIETTEEKFGFPFSRFFDGASIDFCFAEYCPSYRLELGDQEGIVLNMNLFSSWEQMSHISNSAVVEFSANGEMLTVRAASDKRVDFDLYSISGDIPTFVASTEGAGSSELRFQSDKNVMKYICIVRGNEDDSEVILLGAENKVTFTVVPDPLEGEVAEGKRSNISRIKARVGKSSLVGDISFTRKEGSQKIKVRFSPILRKMDNIKIKFIGLDDVSINLVNGSSQTIFEEMFKDGLTDVLIQGREGKLTVYIEGTHNGRFRSKSVTYIL